MTLREEPQVTTRAATLGNGIYFRLIAFRKVGSNYVFQSAADFTTNGAYRLPHSGKEICSPEQELSV